MKGKRYVTLLLIIQNIRVTFDVVYIKKVECSAFSFTREITEWKQELLGC